MKLLFFPQNLSTILKRLTDVLIQMSRESKHLHEADEYEGLLLRLERLWRLVQFLISTYHKVYDFTNLNHELSILLEIIRVKRNEGQIRAALLATEPTGGRPKFLISKEQLEFYLEYSFTVPRIANMLNTSKSTIKRRLKEFGLKKGLCFSTISDEELDNCIISILNRFPNCGYKKMRGFLRAKNTNVQERRVRESMRRVDPEGVLFRALQSMPIIRRKYSVAGPLSLWHMDGNHKLIA